MNRFSYFGTIENGIFVPEGTKMEQQKLNESMIPPYKAALVEAEKSAATVEKYLYHVRQFVAAYPRYI